MWVGKKGEKEFSSERASHTGGGLEGGGYFGAPYAGGGALTYKTEISFRKEAGYLKVISERTFVGSVACAVGVWALGGY